MDFIKQGCAGMGSNIAGENKNGGSIGENDNAEETNIVRNIILVAHNGVRFACWFSRGDRAGSPRNGTFQVTRILSA